jgi:hypothetical protein
MRKLVIASVLALSTVVFVSCNEGNASSKVKNENVKKAEKRDAEISKGAAIIEFDKTSFDFGTVAEGDIVNAEFEVTNAGKTDLIITKASPSCGCTVPTWPKDPIKPGETSKVVAKFNTNGKPNKQVKSITLFTNTAKGREVLTIRGNVTPKAK